MYKFNSVRISRPYYRPYESCCWYHLLSIRVPKITLIYEDIGKGTIKVVVYNFMPTVVNDVVLPVYQYVDKDTSILLGYTNPFTVTGS